MPVTIRHVKRLRTAAFALVLTGCGSSLACSLVGCVSQATLRLHNLSPTLLYPLTVHACFDTRCADVLIDRRPRAAGEQKELPCPGEGRHDCADFRSTGGYVSIAFDDPAAGDQAHSATVVVRDARHGIVMRSSRQLRLVKFAPNGEQCGPICWSAVANFP